MIQARLIYDNWLTEITVPVYGEDGKPTGETQVVSYTGMRTTVYQHEHDGEYACAMEHARLPVPALNPSPADTLTAVWFDDKHAAGLAWVEANADVLLSAEVSKIGEVPNDWPS